MACLRETDATLEKVQRGLEEQEASRVNAISLLENDLKKMSAEIAELQDKMAHEEERNLNITNRLISLGEDLFKVTDRVTEKRRTIVNEHDSLMGAHEVLEQVYMKTFSM